MWNVCQHLMYFLHLQEFTRPRCFDGAYARGLWSAGFAFEMLPDALAFAVRSEVPSRSLGCRSGALLPAKSYTLFLKVLRLVCMVCIRVRSPHWTDSRHVPGVRAVFLTRFDCCGRSCYRDTKTSWIGLAQLVTSMAIQHLLVLDIEESDEFERVPELARTKLCAEVEAQVEYESPPR